MATGYSSAAVTMGHLALKRAIRHAEANDLVSRNVAALVDTPTGQEGRPSKSLTLEQAVAVITAAETLPVMELRPGPEGCPPAGRADVCLHRAEPAGRGPHRRGQGTALGSRGPGRRPARCPPVPPHVARLAVGARRAARPRPSGPAARSAFPRWRSRRSAHCGKARLTNGPWPGNDGRTPDWCSPPIAAPPSTRGTSGRCSSGSATVAGIGDSWTPRELRTSFVSLMSHRGVSIEEIAHLVGHASTRTTEVVYRRELRPVITTGAEIMDDVFRRR